MDVWLVCFDISDDDCRRRIGQLLLRYGERVQRSVFEVSVRDAADLAALRTALRDLVAAGDDDIRFYRLCANCRAVATDLAGAPIARYPAVLIL